MRIFIILFLLSLGASLSPSPLSAAERSYREVGRNLLAHIKTLASDDFQGRAPASPGEELTVNYLIAYFQRLGLLAGNPDGTYFQRVPLLGFTARDVEFSYQAGNSKSKFEFPTDCTIWSKQTNNNVRIDASEMVFVGYGIDAPEYGWNDYKDVDVRGKTIVMLINDPPIPKPDNPAVLDETIFKGKAMTYYGRWTYKYEIALKKGAAAAIIVHETGPASYPYFVVMASNSRENFELESTPHIPVEGWVTLDAAKKLFSAGGKDFDEMKRAALKKNFRPVSLGVTADFHFKNSIRRISSRNVVAKIDGSDPQLKNEFVIYSAHWDHLGRDPKLKGDQIYNGALDNASGTAALLDLALRFSQLPQHPKRSVLFLVTTAEEKGLLGAQHYATHPLHPLSQTVANLNIDGINVWGRSRDVENVTQGNSTLDDRLADFAQKQNREVHPDSTPEKGTIFRADQFEFMKVGIPALYLKAGTNFVDRPIDYGMKKSAEYTANDYHKPSDEIKPDWDLAGAVDDLQLLFDVGLEAANSDQRPAWKPDSEFKPRK